MSTRGELTERLQLKLEEVKTGIRAVVSRERRLAQDAATREYPNDPLYLRNVRVTGVEIKLRHVDYDPVQRDWVLGAGYYNDRGVTTAILAPLIIIWIPEPPWRKALKSIDDHLLTQQEKDHLEAESNLHVTAEDNFVKFITGQYLYEPMERIRGIPFRSNELRGCSVAIGYTETREFDNEPIDFIYLPFPPQHRYEHPRYRRLHLYSCTDAKKREEDEKLHRWRRSWGFLVTETRMG